MTFPSGARLIAATEADCARLAALARRAHTHPWNERRYLDSLRAGHRCRLLLSAQGHPIACCVFSELLDEAEILDVAVDPDWRRRGIAEALLNRVIAELSPRISRLMLEVRSSNSAARSLYRKLGFREDGVRRNYYPAEKGARENAVLMSLPLARP